MDVIEALTALGTEQGQADPYPYYAALHELGEAAEAGSDSVLVMGYDAVSSVLRDPPSGSATGPTTTSACRAGVTIRSSSRARTGSCT
jgi:cytochrome P450